MFTASTFADVTGAAVAYEDVEALALVGVVVVVRVRVGNECVDREAH